MNSLPVEERERERLTLSRASAYARSGKQPEGYALLVSELGRAEGLLLEGEPWANDLLRRWRNAIDRYGERFQQDDEQEVFANDEAPSG